jgi:hypothetical protein
MAHDEKAAHSLYEEISKKSGVSQQDVQKVLGVLGVDNHFDDAAKALGAAPALKDLLLGFHLNKGTVMV